MTKRLTVNFSEEEQEWIDELIEEGEADSKSDAVRELVRRGQQEMPELEDRIAELEEKLDDREQRIADLEEQLAKRSQIEDSTSEIEEKVDVLAKRVEDDGPDPPFVVRWWQWWRNRD